MRRRGTRRPGCSLSGLRCRCTAAARPPSSGPSSGTPSRRRSVRRRRCRGARRRRRGRRRALHRRPSGRTAAAAASVRGGHGRPARPAASSSSARFGTVIRADRRERSPAAPPCETGPRSGHGLAWPTVPTNGLRRCCGPRPPRDLQESTQPLKITRCRFQFPHPCPGGARHGHTHGRRIEPAAARRPHRAAQPAAGTP